MKRERYKLSVSVFLVIRRGKEILLLKRENTGWMDGFFSIPAGAIDGNETLVNAVIREAQEEVGITVDHKDVLLSHTMHCFTHNEEWLGQFFSTKKWKGDLRVMELNKHSEIKWVEVNNLPNNTIPYVIQAINKITHKVNYSSYRDS